jgi:LacI family sucrose operon transcriptional repressor
MTIKEVAKLAGVSPAAVSRYLNGGSISEEKRERVRKAIEETGYRPNPMAQTMRTGRINQVGVIVPRLYSDSVSQITAGASQRLFERGYMTLLGCTDHDPAAELRYMQVMQESQVSGIILMGAELTPEIAQAIRDSRVPVVITGQNFEEFPCVYHDDFHAARDLTGLLIQKGRRRIVMVGAPEKDIAAGLNRRRGAEQALLDAGIDPASMLYETSNFDARGGRDAMDRLLAACPEIDGVVCATDTMAMGALAALRETGRSVPEDVSLVGVGDDWIDEISTPGLTTAHLFFHRCGEEAAGLLLELLRNDGDLQKLAEPQIRLPYLIVERGSV